MILYFTNKNLQRPQQRNPQLTARNGEYSDYGEAFPFIPEVCGIHGLRRLFYNRFGFEADGFVVWFYDEYLDA